MRTIAVRREEDARLEVHGLALILASVPPSSTRNTGNGARVPVCHDGTMKKEAFAVRADVQIWPREHEPATDANGDLTARFVVRLLRRTVSNGFIGHADLRS